MNDLLNRRTAEILEQVQKTLEIPLEGTLVDPSTWIVDEIQQQRRPLEPVDLDALTAAHTAIEKAWNAVNRARQAIMRIRAKRAPEYEGHRIKGPPSRLPIITTVPPHREAA